MPLVESIACTFFFRCAFRLIESFTCSNPSLEPLLVCLFLFLLSSCSLVVNQCFTAAYPADELLSLLLILAGLSWLNRFTAAYPADELCYSVLLLFALRRLILPMSFSCCYLLIRVTGAYPPDALLRLTNAPVFLAACWYLLSCWSPSKLYITPHNVGVLSPDNFFIMLDLLIKH